MMSKKKENNEIEAFIIDAESFTESVHLLQQYRDSLQFAYDELKTIEEIPEESLDDLSEQIEVVDSLLQNFRFSILKTIYGEGIKKPPYH